MIVYGDPSFSASSTELLSGLRDRLSDTAGSPDLGRLRTLLIHAGQVEQAFADAAGMGSAGAAIAEDLTDACAEAFFACWHEAANTPAGVPVALQRAESALQRLAEVPSQTVRVKVPEGYAFYALFPEQYAAAALRWAAAHPRAEHAPVLVAGVRSIGTSLSALVLATLRGEGWDARRITVRPTGHPLSREAEFPFGFCERAVHGLVVDEGPGLSGSSMAAVAEAMVRRGIPPGRITFLPGHTGDPGGSASPEVREWWTRTPRIAVPATELRWDHRSLTDLLAHRAGRLIPDAGGVARVEELGGGLWRRAAYAAETGWPAVCAAFERPKYRCVLGDGRSVLWKFEGLATGPEGRSMAEAAFRVQTERAAPGWSPPPLDQALGFVATPWLEGERLTHVDADDGLLERLARYVAASAGPPLTSANAAEARERLREMLYWNTWELLGEAAAEPLKQLVLPSMTTDVPSSGDGRLAPHEWIRSAEGQVWKMDVSGCGLDHTMVGAQPVWWDVAGAMTEWRLDAEQTHYLLAELRRNLPLNPATELLDYYRAAYAAFRGGQCAMCVGMTADPAERQRLEQAANRYRKALQRPLLDRARSL